MRPRGCSTMMLDSHHTYRLCTPCLDALSVATRCTVYPDRQHMSRPVSADGTNHESCMTFTIRLGIPFYHTANRSIGTVAKTLSAYPAGSTGSSLARIGYLFLGCYSSSSSFLNVCMNVVALSLRKSIECTALTPFLFRFILCIQEVLNDGHFPFSHRCWLSP